MNIKQKFIAQRDNQADDSVIPLINVVFLMLIFFMVAGHIQKSDPIKVEPPKSINEAQPESEPDVVLLVSAEQYVYLNDDRIKIDDIETRLTRLFDQSKNKANFWIQIKADGELPIEKLKPLFSQIKQAGLTKVSVATQLGQR